MTSVASGNLDARTASELRHPSMAAPSRFRPAIHQDLTSSVTTIETTAGKSTGRHIRNSFPCQLADPTDHPVHHARLRKGRPGAGPAGLHCLGLKSPG
jgi:hypothetical protein